MIHTELAINGSPIAYFQAVRITNITDDIKDDDVSNYRVVFGGKARVEGIVSHRYGDGGWKLLEKAIKELL